MNAMSQAPSDITSSERPAPSTGAPSGLRSRFVAPLPEWAWYGVTLLAIGFFTVLALRLWRADISVPFVFSGDSVFSFMLGREMLDHGWYLTNSRLGAPAGQQLYDFPIGSDNLNLATLDVLVNVSRDAVVGVNLFFLLTFFTNGISALWVLRRMRVSPPVAAMAAVLFAIVPYHFLRSEAHLFLSAYYSVPLGVLLAVEAMQSKTGIFTRNRRAMLGRIVLCAIIASAGIYYAVFTLVLLVTAVIVAIARRERRAAGGAVFAGLLIAGLVVISNAPTLIYDHEHGKAQGVAARVPIESELYGQKLTTMVLPMTVHRIAALRDLRARYADAGTAGGMPLGAVPTAGFVILGFVALLSAAGVGIGLHGRHPLRALSVFSAVLLFVATVGGVASLIAYYVTPQIRAWERTSIVFDFLGLAAVAFVLDGVLRRRGDAWHGFARVFVCAAVVSVGALDQTSNAFIPPYSVLGPDWKGTKAFVKQIERSLPTGSMVYQVPYIAFPEVPGVNKMGVYDPMIGYVLSNSLRWSHGAMRGTNADWNGRIASEPLRKQLVQAASAGFAGVWLDRFGYADAGASEEPEIAQVARTRPIVASNGRYVFYSLRGLRARLLNAVPASVVNTVGSETVHPIQVQWDDSLYPEEADGQNRWQWTKRPIFGLKLVNAAPEARNVVVAMTLATGLPTSSTVSVFVGDRLAERLLIKPTAGARLRMIVRVPRGSRELRFASNAARTESATDPRTLYVKLSNASVEAAGLGPAMSRLLQVAE
jgi:phosphoglycerol transferase